MVGSGQVDKESANQTSIGNARSYHHENPDDEEFATAEPVGREAEPPDGSYADREPEKNKKCSQGKMSASKRCCIKVSIVKRGKSANYNSQYNAQDYRP
jgi:hypothetical protein